MAWMVGFVFYMVAMAMTVYDGFPSFVVQPIMGALFTTVGVLLIVIIGIPFFFPRIWLWWSRIWWVSVLLVVVGIASFIVSWHPSLRETVFDPVLQQNVETFHTILSISGWLLMVFGLAWCPLISVRRLIAWVRNRIP